MDSKKVYQLPNDLQRRHSGRQDTQLPTYTLLIAIYSNSIYAKLDNISIDSVLKKSDRTMLYIVKDRK